MHQVFSIGQSGTEILKFYYQETALLDFFTIVFLGPFLLPTWLLFGLPMLGFGGEMLLPPAHDNGYASMSHFQWMWYKYLSFDQQLVLMFFILSGAESRAYTDGNSVYELFNQYSFATWNN